MSLSRMRESEDPGELELAQREFLGLAFFMELRNEGGL